MFWGLGTHFGYAVSQSLMGDRLGHVTNVSGDNPCERGYRSRRELDMHTDSDDMLMMACLQDAKSGGQSRFVSALSIYNEMLASQPELLSILMRGFRYHWRGEQAEGEGPISRFRVPVFSRCNGVVSCVFLRAFIDMAAEDLGEPLGDDETAALDCFQELSERAELQLALNLQPGDAYVANNYTVLHSRTAFQDYAAADKRRYLLRQVEGHRRPAGGRCGAPLLPRRRHHRTRRRQYGLRTRRRRASAGLAGPTEPQRQIAFNHSLSK